MNMLYNKIYEAVNAGIQKALIINNDQTQDTSVKFHNKEISSEFIPYEYRFVDLELPSGLLWAEYNLGAFPSSNPIDWCGNYYAWGEVEPKTEYTQDNYAFCNNKYFIKYNYNPQYGVTDYKKQLEPMDDVAYVTLGESYRMPTKEDMNELLKHTDMQTVQNYKQVNGLNGILFISKYNSNQIFFPLSGCITQIGLSGITKDCRIWTSTLNDGYSDYAVMLHFEQGVHYKGERYTNIRIDSGTRFLGMPVRAVK